MPMAMELGTRPEDVGEILVKVHEDLQDLKDKILAQGDGSSLDLSSLESALVKTEQGIQLKTEKLLQQLNNRVLTLPTHDAQRRAEDQTTTIETTWDLRAATNQGSLAMRQPSQAIQAPPKTETSRPDLSRTPFTFKRTADASLSTTPGGSKQMQGATPGQQFKNNWNSQVTQNPYNPKNREVLNEEYGIQLPLLQDKRGGTKGVNQQVIRGSTVEPLAVLPRQNRIDPQLLPPPISEQDARYGILSLIQRGLIPPAAELTLEPAPVHQRTVQLHHPKIKDTGLHKAPPTSINTEGTFNMAAVKMDRAARDEQPPPAPSPASNIKSITPTHMVPSETPNSDMRSRASSGIPRKSSAIMHKTPVAVKTLELQPLPPPTTPASAPDLAKDRGHRFAIQNGKTRDTSQEFLVFKQHYCLSWGSIVTTLKHLERMLMDYSVPIAFINGDKLADLSIEFELEVPPTVEDLLTVIVNREDVETLICRPGRRFIGPNGQDLAASKIQATYRMFRERAKYLDYRRKKWAAGVIAISWVMNVKMAKVRKQLIATRADHLENFRRRAKIFARNWDRLQTSRRVIIHIPSLGYTNNLRSSITDFNLVQNMQMARICDIKDNNVDVIYVSPVPVNEEMQQYYSKLLGLKPAIDSGSVDDQGDVSDRYKIIVPDSIKSFPTHSMCLATHLKYSPRTLKRIKNLIRGREAYIVTGVPHKDDLHIADALDIPMLSPEPEVAHLYSTKSGSKRIFASANVAVPPGEYDVYSFPQLQECLAQLITENLEVQRWLFKLDNEFDGRGIAYIDVADHLKCYPWAIKEAQRYGEKWSKKWAQEAAYIKIHAEMYELLTNHARPVNTKIYSNWTKYLDAFLSQGGIIEACPPSDSVTALTVDMFIEPTGRIKIVNVGDQIHADTPYTCWGISVPQSSVEPEQLNEACLKVAEACRTRGVVGYFSIDFVTFIHPKAMEQLLWAVDLNLSYTDSQTMFKLMQFVTGGQLDPKTHFFDIPLPVKEEKKTRRRRVKEDQPEVVPNTNRFAVMSTRLQHTNLSVVHYSVFFQMCRAHGIGFDIKEKQGTVFTLIDSFNRETMGMITVGDNLQGALATFARNLSVIHQEISAPNMQGLSNFKPVIEDIEAILGTTLQNADESTAGTEMDTMSEAET